MLEATPLSYTQELKTDGFLPISAPCLPGLPLHAAALLPQSQDPGMLGQGVQGEYGAEKPLSADTSRARMSEPEKGLSSPLA